MFAFERNLAAFSCRIEDRRDNRVLTDVAGYIFLRVVGPHFLLVDVLFEHISKNIGIDLVALPHGAVVEMPVILIEKGKEILEGYIWWIDVLLMFKFDLMFKE